MSILFRDRPIERATVRLPPGFADQYGDLVAQWRGSMGVVVDNTTAMTHPTFWSCVTGIAQDVSMMPVDVIRYVNDTRQEVTPVPQIIAAPSVMVGDPMDWRYQIIQSWLTAGDAWGLVTQTTADYRFPTRIELRNADCIRAEMSGTTFKLFVDNVEHQLWPLGDLWHSPAYTIAGSLFGLSPVEYHKATIGKGLAAEKYGLQFFTDGAHPSGIWKLPGKPDEKVLEGFKEKIKALTRGNRDDLVTGTETEYQQLQTNPSDSQFLETEEWAGVQICSMFREDPVDHGLSAKGSVTYANRMDADLARLKRRQFWVTKMQNVLTAFLPRPQVVKLNVSASLMMTDMERHELHQLRLNSKTTTVNAVKKIEDEAPFEGDQFLVDGVNPYDLPGVPGGMTPIAPKAAIPAKGAT